MKDACTQNPGEADKKKEGGGGSCCTLKMGHDPLFAEPPFPYINKIVVLLKEEALVQGFTCDYALSPQGMEKFFFPSSKALLGSLRSTSSGFRQKQFDLHRCSPHVLRKQWLLLVHSSMQYIILYNHALLMNTWVK